ncbi:uncharacterized protein [Physcomitrium patens]|uniref:Dof-type domain-containing protein n=1 Tax=Physcomitrium patens TaxID=3218 RepID=A0A7I4AMT3_PHYPA|nr:uncharacterized protein LOC112290457 isoform X2 [Physcomitrium patens]|eukprot:XP_024392475.1 uncharacterized protein LOC112290457 isoform X2 [Physcomitrella patens]
MGSSSHENGGDEPRVSKPATVFLGDLSLSGEGPGFCGYSGPTHANTVNYDLGSHKEHYLHQPQPEGEKGGLADRMNRNKGQQPSLISKDAEGQTTGLELNASEVKTHLSCENPITNDVEDDDDGLSGAADKLQGDVAGVHEIVVTPFPLSSEKQESETEPLDSIHLKSNSGDVVADGSSLELANELQNEVPGVSGLDQSAGTEALGPPQHQTAKLEEGTVGRRPLAVADNEDTVGSVRPPPVDGDLVGPSPKQAKVQHQKPALKKPDKLAPCPRCDSLDTKFCYYNNYNANQPRHFCKNCQRYWTAGGTLRNVPVGAGRRKTKHGNSHVRHGGLLDIPAARQDSDMALSRPCLSRGASVPDQVSPLPASSSSSPSTITSLPSSQDRSSSDAVTQTCSMRPAEAVRKHHIPEPQVNVSGDSGNRLLKAEHGGGCEPVLAGEAENCAEACTSSLPGSPQVDAALASQEVQSMLRGPPTTLIPVCGGIVRPVGILDGSVWTAAPTPFGLFNGSWPYGYNVGWSGPAPGAPGAPTCPPGGTLVSCQPAVAWSAPPNGLWSNVCWGSTLIPGMPAGLPGPSWMSPGWGAGWPMPWGPDAAAAAAAAASASMQVPAVPMSGNVSPVQSRLPIRPVLNKHPRDRPELERVESSLWVPKMVKIDDAVNTPRSSVWTAVGAENRVETVASGSNFKAFLPVGDNKVSITSGDRKQVKS